VFIYSEPRSVHAKPRSRFSAAPESAGPHGAVLSPSITLSLSNAFLFMDSRTLCAPWSAATPLQSTVYTPFPVQRRGEHGFLQKPCNMCWTVNFRLLAFSGSQRQIEDPDPVGTANRKRSTALTGFASLPTRHSTLASFFCFQRLTNCPIYKPFALITLQRWGGGSKDIRYRGSKVIL
jgi:hypothetical protein